MDTFVEKFLYCPIDMVWLLLKSKPGDKFQGQHKDLALGQTMIKNIDINLESEDTTHKKCTIYDVSY